MINTLPSAIIMINIRETLKGNNFQKCQTKEYLAPLTPRSHVIISKDVIDILNKATPISEQLRKMKTLSALVFCFFFEILINNTLFKLIITNAVTNII